MLSAVTPDPTITGRETDSLVWIMSVSDAGWPVCLPVIITPSLPKNSAACALSCMLMSSVIACELLSKQERNLTIE